MKEKEMAVPLSWEFFPIFLGEARDSEFWNYSVIKQDVFSLSWELSLMLESKEIS